MNTNGPAVCGDSFDRLQADMQLWAKRREGSAITFGNEAALLDATDMQAFVDRLQSLTSRQSAGAVVDDAMVESMARVVATRAGEDYNAIGEFAQSLLKDTQRALVAALEASAAPAGVSEEMVARYIEAYHYELADTDSEIVAVRAGLAAALQEPRK